ncbi:uncharacterized protein M6B38_416050 [Iris pallida]|uniref:Ribosomal protein L34e superfamily protein n=1 Tax=Iris pallida TaxID=29817 RepID=A0AAX6FKU1_IRIPA|nr:uncharacterized protein M6B38_416050 [Iris pallida]
MSLDLTLHSTDLQSIYCSIHKSLSLSLKSTLSFFPFLLSHTSSLHPILLSLSLSPPPALLVLPTAKSNSTNSIQFNSIMSPSSSSSSSSSSAMVDCRSLIEFCRAFEQHRNRGPPPPPSSSAIRSRRSKSLNPLSHPFCEHSPFAAVDALLLLLVLAALSVLSLPYLLALLRHAPSLLSLLPPVAYSSALPLALLALALASLLALAAYELLAHRLRKCASPYCRGLRKAVEFDIQLESEDCVRCLPPAPMAAFAPRPPLDLAGDHREELEAELRKMAPLGGRTVLIFRSPCGCPAGRMEVWGAKKVRRIKK